MAYFKLCFFIPKHDSMIFNNLLHYVSIEYLSFEIDIDELTY